MDVFPIQTGPGQFWSMVFLVMFGCSQTLPFISAIMKVDGLALPRRNSLKELGCSYQTMILGWRVCKQRLDSRAHRSPRTIALGV